MVNDGWWFRKTKTMAHENTSAHWQSLLRFQVWNTRTRTLLSSRLQCFQFCNQFVLRIEKSSKQLPQTALKDHSRRGNDCEPGCCSRDWHGCCSSICLIRNEKHFHFIRRTKNHTEAFLCRKDVFALLPTGFGKRFYFYTEAHSSSPQGSGTGLILSWFGKHCIWCGKFEKQESDQKHFFKQDEASRLTAKLWAGWKWAQ